MEAGFGGPVWHASVAYLGTPRSYTISEHEVRLRRALFGVGDPALGEWIEQGHRADHLKRRLTVDEWGNRPWGHDLRKTPEGDRLLLAAGCRREWAPTEWTHP